MECDTGDTLNMEAIQSDDYRFYAQGIYTHTHTAENQYQGGEKVNKLKIMYFLFSKSKIFNFLIYYELSFF